MAPRSELARQSTLALALALASRRAKVAGTGSSKNNREAASRFSTV